MSDQKPTQRWHAAPEIGALGADEAISSWLTEAGLLTERLRSACSQAFSVEIISGDSAIPGTEDLPLGDAYTRQIIMKCDDRASVYAGTIAPADTVAQHAWLEQLGTNTLGERLQTTGHVQRSDFEYRLLTTDHPVLLEAAGTDTLWARRSVFHVSGAPLWVIEVFLPAILEL